MKNLLAVLSIILFAVALRLMPHPANVAPITAMALFGGCYLDKRYAFVLPLIALFVSDIFLGFYPAMPFVYASFLLVGLIGLWLQDHKHVVTVVGASLFSSVLFFFITNNVFWMGHLYPKTFAGFIESYVNALPFFRNTLIGDLFYTGLFFGAYEVIVRTLGSKGWKEA